MQRTLTILNERGLHARAAAKFVKCTELFVADIVVTKGDNEVSGSSIMGLMMLNASRGTFICVDAVGVDAEPALDALTELVGDKFGEK
ncbi:MAG: phosphocarrier protein HPr [Sneathiella sp.]|nr:MAG: phosphocarrier protein HPr [Sneathiella sp.]